jgi:hypothetical protein
VLSPSEILETIDVARGFLIGRGHALYEEDAGITSTLAEALVQLADVCVVGTPCAKHGGVTHGKEAEELRAGVEQILKNVADVHDEDALHVLRAMQKSLRFLLDQVDARDSLAFLEASDQKGGAP